VGERETGSHIGPAAVLAEAAMNALNVILLAGLTVGIDARADTEVDSLDFDCPLRALPSQQAVGRVLGLDNFWQTYRARDRLMERVRATCAQGASAVRVLPEAGHSAWHGDPLVVALR
jgi:hypothetical protein